MTLTRLFWSRGAVVFDLDGTLVDTLDGLYLALNDTLYGYGLSLTSRDEVRASMHGGFEASVQAALREAHRDRECASDVLAAYRARYRQLMVSRSSAYPAVREVLETLRTRRCRLAVCTNRDEALAVELLEGLGLRSYFDTVVGRRDGVEPKPHAGPLLRSLHAADVSPADALMVGDSAVDVACAAAAGVPCVVFEGGYGGDGIAPGSGVGRFSSYRALLEALPPVDAPAA